MPFLFFRRNGLNSGSSYRNNYNWKDRVTRDQYSSDKLDRSNKPVNGLNNSLDHTPSHSSSLTSHHLSNLGLHHSLGPHHLTSLSTRRTKKKRHKSRSSDSCSNSSESRSGSRSSTSSSSRSSSSGSNTSKSRSPSSRGSVWAKIQSSLGNYLPHTEFDKQCTIIVGNLPHRAEGKFS